MSLSKGIKSMLIAFLENETKVSSWGITDIQIDTKSLVFAVDGLKFKGSVKITENSNNFTVQIGEMKIGEYQLEEIISTLDSYIEYTDNYCLDICRWITNNRI